MADFTTAIGDVELNDWHSSKLLAQPVLDALTRFTSEGIINSDQILGVSENLDEESDTDIFCPRHGLDLAQSGNVVIVHTHKTRKAPPAIRRGTGQWRRPGGSQRSGQTHPASQQSLIRSGRRCHSRDRHGIRGHVADRFAAGMARVGRRAHSGNAYTVHWKRHSAFEARRQWRTVRISSRCARHRRARQASRISAAHRRMPALRVSGGIR